MPILNVYTHERCNANNKKNERFNWLSLLNFNLSIDIHFLSFNQIYSNIILFLLKDEMTIIL